MADKRTEYTKVSIKKELLEPIEKFIKENPQLGYRSLAQFVEDAIRRRADELLVFRSYRYASKELPVASRAADILLKKLLALVEEKMKKEEKKEEVG